MLNPVQQTPVSIDYIYTACSKRLKDYLCDMQQGIRSLPPGSAASTLPFPLPPGVEMVGVAVSTLGVVVRFIDDTDEAGDIFLVTEVMLPQLPVAPRDAASLVPTSAAVNTKSMHVHTCVSSSNNSNKILFGYLLNKLLFYKNAIFT